MKPGMPLELLERLRAALPACAFDNLRFWSRLVGSKHQIFHKGSFGKRWGRLGHSHGRCKTNRYQGDVFMVEDDEIEDTEGDGLALA